MVGNAPPARGKCLHVTCRLRIVPLGTGRAFHLYCRDFRCLHTNPLLPSECSERMPFVLFSQQAEVFASDCMRLPYRSGIFDAALSIAVLHHFSSEVRYCCFAIFATRDAALAPTIVVWLSIYTAHSTDKVYMGIGDVVKRNSFHTSDSGSTVVGTWGLA